SSSSTTAAEAPGTVAATTVASLVAFSTAVGGGGGGGGGGDANAGVVSTGEKRGAQAAPVPATSVSTAALADLRVALAGGATAAARVAKRPETVAGTWGSRIREAEEELRALQETKIPRVMKALADVSQQRRKLESTAASLAARSAAASARLAQDSRDAAAALLAELRARREVSTQQRQKQASKQLHHRQQHGAGTAGGVPALLETGRKTSFAAAAKGAGAGAAAAFPSVLPTPKP
ncbi:unnamed protein product, partial [Ectocarpus sp. 12 AP-2014]